MSGSESLVWILALLVASGVTLSKSYLLSECQCLPPWCSGRSNEMLPLRTGSVTWEEIRCFRCLLAYLILLGPLRATLARIHLSHFRRKEIIVSLEIDYN